MGVPQTASPQYSAFQKERLGWLGGTASPAIQTVQSSGTYAIYPYEIGGSGPNALKVLKSTDPTGAKTWYYLEARQAVGYDAYLLDGIYYSQNETSGVLFHIGTDGNGNTSDLLDMSPQTSTATGWLDNSLAVGQTFQDATAGVTFSTAQVSSSGAAIQITFAGANTKQQAALAVSTNQSRYSLGQTVTISVTAMNSTSPVSGVSVAVNVAAPNGKLTTLKGSTGTNGIASFAYKTSKRSSVGTYSVQASTAGAGLNSTAAASTSFVVQ
jgi:hypothetical protein